MTDSPHYVKIEMGTGKGWWTTSEHARLVDPGRYAQKVYEQTNWCRGVRITSHDDGTVWSAGAEVGAVPETQLAGLGSMDPVPERDLGVGHPSDPESRDLRAHWSDVLGDIEADTPTTPNTASAPEPQANPVDKETVLGVVEDDVLGEIEPDATSSWDDVL